MTMIGRMSAVGTVVERLNCQFWLTILGLTDRQVIACTLRPGWFLAELRNSSRFQTDETNTSHTSMSDINCAIHDGAL